MELIVVLDMNAYSDWRRSGRWHQWIAIADRVVVPVIVLGELYHGFRKGDRTEYNQIRGEAARISPRAAGGRHADDPQDGGDLRRVP